MSCKYEIDGKVKTENCFQMSDVWLWYGRYDSYRDKTKEKVIHKSNTINQSQKSKSVNWLRKDN